MTAALKHLVRAAGGGPIACPCDLWCDAAAIAQDGACSWPDALNGAAAGAGAGFSDFGEASIAIVGAWRYSIRKAQPTTERGRDAVRDALRMLHDASGDLIGAGWGAVDLFGLDPLGKRHGLAFRLRGGVVQLVEAGAIQYRAGAAGRLATFDRQSTAGDALPFWEIRQ